MHIYFLAFLIGGVAGLRALTAPAVVSWAAYLGWINLENTWLAFLGYWLTPYIISVLAIGELITDQLPSTPSRKLLVPFATRIASGGLCGAAIGAQADMLVGGLVAGMIGAVAGTLGGYEVRKRLATAVGRDLPVALLEDAAAIGLAILAVCLVK